MALRAYEIRPYVLGNIFLLAELICISLYYKRKLFTSSPKYLWIVACFALGFCIHTIYMGISNLNILGASVLCLFYIIHGLMGYLKLLRKPEELYLSRSTLFWISTSFFIYAASNCLVFLFATYLKRESYLLFMAVWGSFFTVVNILHYILIGVGLYKTEKSGT